MSEDKAKVIKAGEYTFSDGGAAAPQKAAQPAAAPIFPSAAADTVPPVQKKPADNTSKAPDSGTAPAASGKAESKNNIPLQPKAEDNSVKAPAASVKPDNKSDAPVQPKPAEKKPVLSDSDVTAHTSSLWKYNPIPEKPAKFPEYLSADGEGGETGISITAARVRGKLHKHDGTNSDDWFEYRFGGGMAFAAVSDGAGSKSFSRVGARTACTAAAEHMQKNFTSFFSENCSALEDAAKPYSDPAFTAVCTKLAGIMQGAVCAAAAAVEEEADRRRTDADFTQFLGREPVLSDFSATLLITAVIPVITAETGKRENLIISVQIGDGMIATINAQAEFTAALSLLGEADSGEFSGETDFLTSSKMKLPENIMKRTKIQRRACTEVLMMTDGVADDYFPNSPQLLRLYMDLKANGILRCEKRELSEENKSIAQLIPAPKACPWVNDNDIIFNYQYISNVCESTGLSLEQLWDMPDVLYGASLAAFGVPAEETPSEQLKLWLDNYVQRGSFDDRTLLVIHIDN